MRKYTFHTSRTKGSPRSYTKTEENLTPQEINLLLGDLLNKFDKAPDKVKEGFLDKIFEYLMQVKENIPELNAVEQNF